jgi:hypothetical protein
MLMALLLDGGGCGRSRVRVALLVETGAMGALKRSLGPRSKHKVLLADMDKGRGSGVDNHPPPRGLNHCCARAIPSYFH